MSISKQEAERLLAEATPGPWNVGGISINDGSISIEHEEYRIIICYVTNAASLGDFISSALKGRRDFGAPDTAKTQFANARLIAAAPFLAETVIAQAEDIERKDQALRAAEEEEK